MASEDHSKLLVCLSAALTTIYCRNDSNAGSFQREPDAKQLPSRAEACVSGEIGRAHV